MPPILPIPPNEPYRSAVGIAHVVKTAGGRAFIVGGGVRDILIGRRSSDLDMEVHGLSAGTVERICRNIGKVDAVGKSFGVLKITTRSGAVIDLALPRKDSKIAPGHRGFRIQTDAGLSLSEAAKRRDFTVNAMAWDPLDGTLHDPWGGVSDIRAKRLRVTDPSTFADDPLRVLRAIQMVGRFDLHIDADTKTLLRKTARALAELPRERHQEEWKKLFLKSERPSVGLRVATNLALIPKAKRWTSVDRAAAAASQEHWPDHDRWVVMLVLSLVNSKKSLEIFGVDSGVRHEVEHIHKALDVSPKTDGDLRRLATLLAPSTLMQWHRVQSARKKFNPRALSRIRSRAKRLEIWEQPPRDVITGKDLIAHGFSAGPMIGRAIGLANNLRDDLDLSRRDILHLIRSAKNPPSALRRMEDVLSQQP